MSAMRVGRWAGVAAGALALPAALAAQVGHPPARSPYTDLEYRQEWTLYGGQFSAGKDPAGVAPQKGGMVGMRYDIRLGGPAYFSANLAQVFSERTVLDPAKAATARDLGTRANPIYLMDVGFTMHLTGFKAYHRFVPFVLGGLGVASDLKKRDVGQYQFGTPFAFNLGAGVKWVPPGSSWQLRADVGNHFYQIRYPNTYYQTESGSAPILQPSQAKNFWKSNPSLTLGVSYLFFR